MIDLKAGIRQKAELVPFETVDIADMAEVIKADTLNLVENKLGKQFLHLENSATGAHYSIGFGKKVNLMETEPTKVIAEVVKNYVIYAGVSEGTDGVKYPWFTFGTIPTGKASVSVSLSSILSQLETA